MRAITSPGDVIFRRPHAGRTPHRLPSQSAPTGLSGDDQSTNRLCCDSATQTAHSLRVTRLSVSIQDGGPSAAPVSQRKAGQGVVLAQAVSQPDQRRSGIPSEKDSPMTPEPIGEWSLPLRRLSNGSVTGRESRVVATQHLANRDDMIRTRDLLVQTRTSPVFPRRFRLWNSLRDPTGGRLDHEI